MLSAHRLVLLCQLELLLYFITVQWGHRETTNMFVCGNSLYFVTVQWGHRETTNLLVGVNAPALVCGIVVS